MMADIFDPIFTLTITVLTYFIQKNQNCLGALYLYFHQRIILGPLGANSSPRTSNCNRFWLCQKPTPSYFFCIIHCSAWNWSLFKQFTYMHLKGLVTHFQKMILVIMLWLTVPELLGFKVEEFCWSSADWASFSIFYSLISQERCLIAL